MNAETSARTDIPDRLFDAANQFWNVFNSATIVLVHDFRNLKNIYVHPLATIHVLYARECVCRIVAEP